MKYTGLCCMWRLDQEAEVGCRANNWEGWESGRERDMN